MTDDIDRLLERSRGVSPPEGAKARVLQKAEAEIAGPPRRMGWPPRVFGAIALITAAALMLYVLRPTSTFAQVVDAEGVTLNGEPIEPGDVIGGGTLVISPGGRLRVSLGSSTFQTSGSTSVELSEEKVVVLEGTIEVNGDLHVAGDGCKADASGITRFVRQAGRLRVVDVGGGAATEGRCTVETLHEFEHSEAESTPLEESEEETPPEEEELDLPSEGDELEHMEIRSEGVVRKSRRAARVPTASELQQQVRTLEHVMLLRKRGAEIQALQELQRMRQKTPRTALRHEIDLNIIDILSELGRHENARREARQFLRRHPRSAKRDEVMRLIAR